MTNKSNWKDYFTFSKKERNGFLIVIAIVGMVIAYPFIFKNNKEKNHQDAETSAATLKEKNNFFSDENNEESENETSTYGVQQEKLFAFDPNTLSQEQWINFGLSPKTAKTITNYTSKGGKFYKPEDIRKIWGLKKEDADLLIPFIKIDKQNYAANNSFNNNYGSKKTPSIIDINNATTEQWKALPGIGDVLSERIVKFKNSIKGFKEINDVKKVYGISDETFANILPYLKISKNNSPSSDNFVPQTIEQKPSAQKNEKVNINTSSERDMIAGGIPRNIAKAIKVYREQNGAFKKTEDLKNIIFIDESAYQKLLPLIVVE